MNQNRKPRSFGQTANLCLGNVGGRSRDIAVIGLDDPALAAFLVNETGYWMDAETALGSFAKTPFVDLKVPDDFRRALIANYGSRADLERSSARRWEKDIRSPPA